LNISILDKNKNCSKNIKTIDNSVLNSSINESKNVKINKSKNSSYANNKRIIKNSENQKSNFEKTDSIVFEDNLYKFNDFEVDKRKLNESNNYSIDRSKISERIIEEKKPAFYDNNYNTGNQPRTNLNKVKFNFGRSKEFETNNNIVEKLNEKKNLKSKEKDKYNDDISNHFYNQEINTNKNFQNINQQKSPNVQFEKNSISNSILNSGINSNTKENAYSNFKKFNDNKNVDTISDMKISGNISRIQPIKTDNEEKNNSFLKTNKQTHEEFEEKESLMSQISNGIAFNHNHINVNIDKIKRNLKETEDEFSVSENKSSQLINLLTDRNDTNEKNHKINYYNNNQIKKSLAKDKNFCDENLEDEIQFKKKTSSSIIDSSRNFITPATPPPDRDIMIQDKQKDKKNLDNISDKIIPIKKLNNSPGKNFDLIENNIDNKTNTKNEDGINDNNNNFTFNISFANEEIEVFQVKYSKFYSQINKEQIISFKIQDDISEYLKGYSPKILIASDIKNNEIIGICCLQYDSLYDNHLRLLIKNLACLNHDKFEIFADGFLKFILNNFLLNLSKNLLDITCISKNDSNKNITNFSETQNLLNSNLTKNNLNITNIKKYKYNMEIISTSNIKFKDIINGSNDPATMGNNSYFSNEDIHKFEVNANFFMILHCLLNMNKIKDYKIDGELIKKIDLDRISVNEIFKICFF